MSKESVMQYLVNQKAYLHQLRFRTPTLASTGKPVIAKEEIEKHIFGIDRALEALSNGRIDDQSEAKLKGGGE